MRPRWGPKTTFCMRLPLIPFFVYWWLSHPTTEGLEKIMNTLGIVDALMLTLAVGMAGTFDYNELRAADDRFMSAVDPTVPNAQGYASYYYTSWWMTMTSSNTTIPNMPVAVPDGMLHSSMSTKFIQAIMLSTFFYTISLLIVVLLLVFMNMADLDKTPEGEHEATGEDKKRLRKLAIRAELELSEWYKYNHYAMSSAVIGFLIGTILFFRAMWFLVMIKAPDYYVLAFGEANTGAVYAWPALLGYIIGGLMAICGLLGCWGNYAVHALNEYGKPQNVRHVVFFGPPDTTPETDTDRPPSATSKSKIAPEPSLSHKLQMEPEPTAGDNAKLASLLIALATEMQALGKRMEAQQASAYSL